MKMHIAISERFRPFSHQPGAACLLPRTPFVVEAFPALVRIQGVFEMPLAHQGPVREFTLQQDLEKGCVYVWGISKEGRFWCCVEAREGAIEVTVRSGYPILPEGVSKRVFPCEHRFVTSDPSRERLFLGCHRAQDWDLVLRRFDVRQILPTLYQLSHWVPGWEPESGENQLQFVDDWELFLKEFFSKMLVPRLRDEEHQGFSHRGVQGTCSPCALVRWAGKKIRSLFFNQEGRDLYFLPHGLFDSGRMTDVYGHEVGLIDFEWRARALKRVIVRANREVKVRIFVTGKPLSFRLRRARQEKGFRVQEGEEIALNASAVYFLDRFQ